MPRRRTAEVRETIEELHQLREYYENTPRADTLHLLILLKQDERRTIAEAAEKVGLSHRKAERLWKKYREMGLVGVVGEGDLSGMSKPDQELSSSSSELSILEILLNVSSILDFSGNDDLILRMRKLVYRIAPSVKYLAVSFPYLTILDGKNVRPIMNHSTLPDGQIEVSAMNPSDYHFHYERVFAAGKRHGVDLSEYADPPLGQDYYFENAHSRENGIKGTYIGSMLFFGARRKHSALNTHGLSSQDCTLLLALRPFFTRILISKVYALISKSASPVRLTTIVEEIKNQCGLSPTEVRVLMAIGVGRTDADIADLLDVSQSTVRTHSRNIQSKMGLKSRREVLSEIYARANFF